TFGPGNCSIEIWPDVWELPKSNRVATAFRHADGSVAEVFSSVQPSTVELHFQWMRDYGIDGVFLQRFATTTRDPRFRAGMDTVLQACRAAARDTKREWVLMYDLSGLQPGQTDSLMADWKYLQGKFQLTDATVNPAYMRHKGKPLVALWGLGFSDRPPMLDEWEKLLRFFKEEASPGGCSVMVGVPTFWRTLKRDAISDPQLHKLIALADVVSPWTVGRFDSPKKVQEYADKTMSDDVAWCREHKLDFLPVAFPGFSWHNLMASRGQTAKLNAIPRLGGRFLWSQFATYHKAGAQAFYIAMFDEMDEGTAIFKVRNDPPVGNSPFLAEPEVPGDHYLWLTGQAGRMLRSEKVLKVGEEMPKR
ncbi:MAG TPA: glycoside hydrolase family 71/99-like protein, partial [Candidatus Saccharimonadales bacterium]|nr:glycoside hydrolase family 71/99-like protein [Candidatus Saccharimonadales bacterium]